ncbi:MAG TPA: FAD-binding oxidoreductase [Solirubrobacteraceae bacterium]|nr:FAD-binding oxidoreductase [Solirubrobacteraceae bacterium]
MSLATSPIRDFAGEVLAPGNAAYDDARRVHNTAVDRRPALIARCAGSQDVARALRHARERGMPVTVRGGGHAPGGFALADGALAVDLSRMRAVNVDPARRVVRAQGGATWRELDAATQAHGLAVTGARLPSVGVAGFTLGSGSGWLERKLGLAADLLRSARVITAGGDLVTASADEHPELFWALRGGGPSFGVVVELELALAEVGPEVLGGVLGWPVDRTAEVAAAYSALMAGAPDDRGGGLALLDAPPMPFVPEPLQGAPIVSLLVLWTGAPEQGHALLRPLRELAPAVDAVRPMPYAALQAMFERPVEVQVPTRTHADGGFLGGLPSDAVAAAVRAAEGRPSQLGSVLLQPMGGSFARVPEQALPLGRRDAPWHWQAGTAWFESADDARSRAWVAGMRRALAPWSAGESYPNFIPEADPARLRAAYAPAVFERLRAVRVEWDPEGVFGAGHAIPLPAA